MTYTLTSPTPDIDVSALRERLRKGLDCVTPGPWFFNRGFSDWGLPRTNSVRTKPGTQYGDDGLVAEILAVTPYCLGSSRKERAASACGDANAEHIAACSPDNIAALLSALDRAEKERDEARDYAAQARIRENETEDRRIHDTDKLRAQIAEGIHERDENYNQIAFAESDAASLRAQLAAIAAARDEIENVYAISGRVRVKDIRRLRAAIAKAKGGAA